MEKVSSIVFQKENYPEVVRIANELAELQNRRPHDAMKIFIEREGQKEIHRLKAEKGL